MHEWLPNGQSPGQLNDVLALAGALPTIRRYSLGVASNCNEQGIEKCHDLRCLLHARLR